MKVRRYVLIGTVIACCTGSFGWYTSVSGKINAEGPAPIALSSQRPIPTTLADEYSLRKTRLFPGTVQAKRSANIGFSVDGLLVELNGREGLPVKKGDVLARIDQRDFKNSFDAAKANYLRAEADFKRTETLQKRSVISQSEYDTSKTAYEVALAEMNIRKKGLDDTVITAPYDAVISKRFAENNEHIKKQASILAIQDISEIEVVIQIPERLMAHGAIEDFIDIWVNFDADTRRWFPGQIKEYSVQTDPVTRTYDVAVRLERPTDLKIYPGMTATVRTSLQTKITGEPHGIMAIIPAEAVFTGPDGASYTWIIPEEGGKPLKQRITIGELSQQGITVVKGLEPGTRIATAGVHTLTENMSVRPMKKGAEGLDG
ncbi:efflux RND transporter periplasmic adaptor subunit [Desulfopila sp. IMCC35008]|uniref:efflux RND transporter periplasmic adaptor subunit n=1 Tax=Desulfopila sp. IMCC35008 TaxID=2653858 RepID=UPI0013CF9368|nr:efflux RND transporter periplasmic adaptor subunit [Desulfopila sp. IMCC35008]